MSTLPIGAYVAAALEAANIPCDSGEDVDRFLDELAERGYVVVPGPATMFRFTSWDDTALVIAAGSGGVRSDALARRRGSRDRRSRMRIVWGDEVPGARELPAGHRLCFYGLTFGWLGIGVIRSVKRPSKARRGDE